MLAARTFDILSSHSTRYCGFHPRSCSLSVCAKVSSQAQESSSSVSRCEGAMHDVKVATSVTEEKPLCVPNVAFAIPIVLFSRTHFVSSLAGRYAVPPSHEWVRRCRYGRRFDGDVVVTGDGLP